MESLNNIIPLFKRCSNKPIDKVFIRYTDKDHITTAVNIKIIEEGVDEKVIYELLYNLFDNVYLKSVAIRGSSYICLVIECYNNDKAMTIQNILSSILQFERVTRISFEFNMFANGVNECAPVKGKGIENLMNEALPLFKNSNSMLSDGILIQLNDENPKLTLPIIYYPPF